MDLTVFGASVMPPITSLKLPVLTLLRVKRDLLNWHVSYNPTIFKVANHVVCLIGLTTLRTSNLTSQAKKLVHNFCYTKSNFMRLSANTPSSFSAHDCVEVSPGFAAVLQITWNN